MSYQYEPLRSRYNEIRLLRLLPSSDVTAQVCCELEIVSLDYNPVYTALSYCWADPPGLQVIQLHEYDVTVTKNLRAALISLRDEREPKYWWIDTLCINQHDLEERSSQVLRMTSIYRSAFEVVAWIGSEQPGQEPLDQFLDSSLQLFRSESQEAISIEHFRHILLRKFWTRIWIVQEISVAINVMVMCGKSRVNWEKLREVFDLYEEQQSDATKNILQSNPDTFSNILSLDIGVTSTEVELTQSYAGFKTLNEFRKIFRAREPLNFISALTRTSKFLATDQRDRFYALLGLVHDGRLYIPTPSYAVEFDTLRAQMAINYLRVTLDLDLSLLCNARKSLSGSVPSWTPDWLRLDQVFELEYATRQHSDQKSAATGKSVFVPVNDRLSSRFIGVEILLFQQIDGLSTTYGESGSSFIQSTSYGQHPHHISAAYRSKLVEALFHCLLDDSDLMHSLHPSHPSDHSRVFLILGVPRLEIFSDRHYIERILLLYRSDGVSDPNYCNNITSVILARWAFGSPELSVWLEENRSLLLRTHTFQSLCSRTEAHLWSKFRTISILILLLATLLTLRAIFDFYLSTKTPIVAIIITVIVLSLYHFCVETSHYFWDIIQFQKSVLKRVDSRWKNRRLRLAVMGGGPPESVDFEGMPALVPGNAQKGDQIVIIKGCTVPVVLRPFEDGYQVIGMAYVHEVMEGQLMEWPATRWKKCNLY